MTKEQLEQLLRRNGIKPNFTYGQNFLLDDIVLQDMVDDAKVSKQDAVLEIGPGIGNLTEKLCQRAGFVLSLEKDPKFFPILHAVKKNHRDNFWFEITDALKFNFESFFKEHGFSNYKVVANIPYFITGKILKMLLNAKQKPESITILMQKEVAENVIAGVGDLSILAISVQLYGEAKILYPVKARSFFPPPKVDSAVLHIELFKKPKYDIGDEKHFFRVIKSCFAGKRKQLHNTLVNNLHLQKSESDQILRELKINPASRPQELSIDQWIALAKKIPVN